MEPGDRVAPLKTLFSCIFALVSTAPLWGEAGVSGPGPDDSAYETDRPGEVENPYTLRRGQSELATYATAMNAAAREDQFGDGGSAVVIDTALRVGLAGSLEGVLTVDTFLAANGSGADDGAAAGLGYATLLAKWNFLRSASGDFGIALAPFVRTPINRQIGQSSRTATGVILPFNVDLEGGWELEGSTSMSRTPKDGGAWATAWEGQASLQRTLTARLCVYAELQLEAGDDLPAWGAEEGVTVRLSASAVLDVGSSLGLGRNSRGRMVYAGLGWRF
jgi:hypothetical protein